MKYVMVKFTKNSQIKGEGLLVELNNCKYLFLNLFDLKRIGKNSLKFIKSNNVCLTSKMGTMEFESTTT